MPDTAPLAGDTPQAATEPAGGAPALAPTPPPQSAEDWDQTLDGLNAEDLADLLNAPPVEPAPAPSGPPATATSPGPDTEDDEEEEDPPPPAAQVPAIDPPPALDPPGSPPSRIRLTGLPAEQQTKVADYVKAIREGKSPEEAAAILAPVAVAQAPQAASTPAPAATPARVETPAPPADLAAIDTRIAAAIQTLKDAQQSYDAVAISEATVALTDLKIERAQAVHAGQAAEAASATYATQFETHVANLRKDYPDLDNEDSPLSIRLGELRIIENAINPGHDRDPAFIVQLAARAHRDVQGRPQPTGPALAIPQPQPPRSRPVGSVPPGSPAVSKTMSKEEAERSFDKHLAGMSEEEQSAFLAGALPYPR